MRDDHGHQDHPGGTALSTRKDPVCGMDVIPGQAAGGSADHAGSTYWFCSNSCREKFLANPARYANPVPVTPPKPAHEDRIYTCPMHPQIRQKGPGNCPICGMALEPITVTAE